MRDISSVCIILVFALVITNPPCFSTEYKAPLSESKSIPAIREFADTSSRPYAVVVDTNTLEHPEWGQVVEALKKKYNAEVFVAHYPNVGTIRKALNEYMPWYVCFIAQPEQATREMITAAAYTMTWLDDDPYEDAIWAVLTGFVVEDALRIVDAEPLVVRKELSAHNWDGWLDWLEAGVSFYRPGNKFNKLIKNSHGVEQRLECQKETIQEIIEVLNRDDCDIITIAGHATEHAFYLGKLNASDNYITHNEKGDIYGIDTRGKIHYLTEKNPKIFYAPGSCDIGHIDGPSSLSLAWIHNGVNAFWGHMYIQGRHCHAYHITEYFMALQDRYTFAEAVYANWLALRFSVDEQLELHLCCDEGGKGTVLYGDPAWDARVKHTTVPAYTQDLNIEHLSDGMIELTVSVTLNHEWLTWGQPGIIRPVILLPFRIKEARIEHTNLDKVGVADNFIALDLDKNSIGESGLRVGTKKSVVLYAQELEVWPFLSENEVDTRIRERKLDNISRRIGFLTDETVDPNERIKKATMRDMFRTPNISEASDEQKAELLDKAIDFGVSTFQELLDKHPTSSIVPSTKQAIERVQQVKKNRALREAVKKKDVEQVKLLITEGADVNAKYPGAETVLQLASVTYITELVKLLLDAGADISAKNNWAQTALHLAARWDDGDIVELLLNKGADINAKDEEFGFTALHYAAQFGNRNAAELLIARDADINSKDKQGHTPLYIAVNHDYRVAELLIYKSADSSIKTESGQTLLQLAQQRKRVESTIPDMIFDGKPDSLFGYPIACGDVDADGYDDILIGAVDDYDSRGRVYLYYGGPDLDSTADLILEGQNKRDWFGSGIVCGDIDNDGYDDIIIAAGGYNERRGRVYLFWGSDRNSMDANSDKIFVGEERKGSLFGGNSPVIYDIDNDGYDDIILGASYNHDDHIGRAYLYYGSTKELMDTSVDLIFTAEDPSDQYTFGLQIACGNIDNDDYGDIVIVSQSYPFSKQKVRAHLYYGDSRSNMNVEADLVFEVKSEGAVLYGRDIVCVDQNRDGYDDIVIGAYGYNEKQGRAFLFHGNSKQSLDTDRDIVLDGELRSSGYGHNVVCGDIDGDNVNDLIIGARDFRQGVGRVYVYWGSELTSPDPKPSRIFTGENSNDFFGQGLACGDVNNDGFDDLVIGAYKYKAGTKQQGRVYLYYGEPNKK